MSANDNYPALIQEMAYLREAATGNLGRLAPTPVLGICLGAQLLSRALGGAVAPTGGYQFGLRKIDVTEAGAADPVFSEIKIPWSQPSTANSSPSLPMPSGWQMAPCSGVMAATSVSPWPSATVRPMGSSSNRS